MDNRVYLKGNVEEEIPLNDLWIVIKYAMGNKSYFVPAIEIHRKHIYGYGVRGTDAMIYMAEVDNPCPDVMLRNNYRKVLLNKQVNFNELRTS